MSLVERKFLFKKVVSKKSFGSSESWSFWKAQKRPRGDIEVDTLRFLFEKKILFSMKKNYFWPSSNPFQIASDSNRAA
jgi:hypothetical protein